MILQIKRRGESAESVQQKVDGLFSEAPLSTGLHKLADRHGSLVDPRSTGRGSGQWFGGGWTLFSLSGFLIVLVIFVGSLILFMRIRRGYWLGKDQQRGEPSPPVPDKVVGSRALRDEARKQAQVGEYREAIRLLLLSLLTLISERKLLVMAANLTTREIYARLPKNRDAKSQESEAQYLFHFFQVFEEASYGGREVGAVEFEDLDGILGRGIQHELLNGSKSS